MIIKCSKATGANCFDKLKTCKTRHLHKRSNFDVSWRMGIGGEVGIEWSEL